MSEIDLPLVTFALVAYNQENYIYDAIQSSFLQDYPLLEIIISDDFSTDGTYAVMEKAVSEYHGKHIVRLVKQDENMGVLNHLVRIFEISDGDLIVVAAGDDLSEPNRVSSIVHAWIASGRPRGALSSTVVTFSDNEKYNGVFFKAIDPVPKDAIYKQVESDILYINGASAAYTKDVVTAFPKIREENKIEDKVFGFRALLLGSCININDPLVKYRWGHSSLSAAPRLFDCKQWRKRIDNTMAYYRQYKDDYIYLNNHESADVVIDAIERKLDRLNGVLRCLDSCNFLCLIFKYPVPNGIKGRIGFAASFFGVTERNSHLMRIMLIVWRFIGRLRRFGRS